MTEEGKQEYIFTVSARKELKDVKQSQSTGFKTNK